MFKNINFTFFLFVSIWILSFLFIFYTYFNPYEEVVYLTQKVQDYKEDVSLMEIKYNTCIWELKKALEYCPKGYCSSIEVIENE